MWVKALLMNSNNFNMTTEQQEDDFALKFAYFLDKNYGRAGLDEYIPKDSNGILLTHSSFYNAVECLAEFRKQHIPMLPALPFRSEESTLATTAEYARVDKILLKGYTQLMSILYQEGPVQKQDLNEIIRHTLIQASQPIN